MTTLVTILKKTSLSLAALLFAAISFSSAVSALDAYAGFGAGHSNSDANGLKLDMQLAERGYSSRSEVEDRDLSLRIFAGLQLTQHLGVEVELIDLGDVTSDVFLDNGNVVDFSRDLNRLHPISARALTLAGTARIHIDDSGYLMLRAGYLRWDGEVATASINGAFAEDNSANGDGYVIGAGLWLMNETFGVRMGYDWFHLNGDGEREDQEIGVVNMSILWWLSHDSNESGW